MNCWIKFNDNFRFVGHAGPGSIVKMMVTCAFCPIDVYDNVMMMILPADAKMIVGW
jgi:hypothetical protein